MDVRRLAEREGAVGLDDIAVDVGGCAIGALATLADVGRHEGVRRIYPGLARVASVIATPQIRARATMGGVICQRTRCWYYRHHAFPCFKKGGEGCPAREGDNLYGIAFDLGPCAYPHPSSVALALMAYDASVDTTARASLPIADVYGDGSDPARVITGWPKGRCSTRVLLPAVGADGSGGGARGVRVLPTSGSCPERSQSGRGWIVSFGSGSKTSGSRWRASAWGRSPTFHSACRGSSRRSWASRPPPSDSPRPRPYRRGGAVETPGGVDKRPMIVATVLEALEEAAAGGAEAAGA